MRLSADSKATCTFSSTVKDEKVCAIWNVRPTPLRQMARGGRPAMLSPPSRTRPESGASWPPTMLKVVVLPAPLGPINASNSPACTEKETPCTAFTPPKDLLS